MENMENPRKLDDKEVLNLRGGWKQIDKKDVERIIRKKDKGNYWWFSKDKKRITTLKGGKVDNYKASDIELLLDKEVGEVSNIKQEIESEILIDLFLTPDNQVKCTADAYEKARCSNKTTFWFISKGKNKAVVVMDFSHGKKPNVTKYPLDKYKLRIKPVKV